MPVIVILNLVTLLTGSPIDRNLLEDSLWISSLVELFLISSHLSYMHLLHAKICAWVMVDTMEVLLLVSIVEGLSLLYNIDWAIRLVSSLFPVILWVSGTVLLASFLGDSSWTRVWLLIFFNKHFGEGYCSVTVILVTLLVWVTLHSLLHFLLLIRNYL